MIDSLKLFNYWHLFRKNTLFAFKNAIDFLHVKIYMFFSVFINILIWFLARRIKADAGSDRIALHYTVDFGIDYYGTAGQVFIIPVFGLIIILFNFSVLLLFSRRKDFSLLSHLFLATALLANLVLLAAISSVYLINFR